MIEAFHKKYVSMKSDMRYVSTNESIKTNVDNFKDTTHTKLFDICACKCFNFNNCSCSPNKRVPTNMQAFISDQRNYQSMNSSADLLNTRKSTESNVNSVNNVNNLSRLSEDDDMDSDAFYSPSQNNVEAAPKLCDSSISLKRSRHDQDQENENPDTANDIQETCISLGSPRLVQHQENVHPDDANDVPQALSRHSSQNRIRLTNTVLVSDRFNISERAAAALITAPLVDFRIVNENKVSLIVDRNKIARERKRVRSMLPIELKSLSKVEGLYFDGRRDPTLFQERKGTKFYKSIKTEDHYSLLKEPGSEYIGHITPVSGDAPGICKTICDFF